ncbi:MAG: N-acetylglucosamine-6-phosphate deacetylase [Clostridia bacterium]|nr:N-acetylglucosamine-6-phosphate deacetylase [Clostridia bacterium]
MLIENVYLLMKDGVFRKGCIAFDETICRVEAREGGDTGVGPYLIPGLIDIHSHGALNGDHTDGSEKAMREMAVYYAQNGVTSFLATTITAQEETLHTAMENIARYERPPNGARCIGINMEGPFLSYDKRGAHPPDLLMPPDISMFERLYSKSGNSIKLVSIAPELPGAMDFIREISQVCKVALAHTSADYQLAMQAFGNGATHVTHLFNAMSPLLHRDPGMVGAAMDALAYVEAICDGIHLHPAIIRAIYQMFPQRVCMISDSVRSAGLPDGNYESGGMPIIVKNGKATLQNGTIAGSTISLMQGVRHAVDFGIPLGRAITAASANNAHAIGMEGKLGLLNPGAYADMVLLDGGLNIQKVYIAGKELQFK